jgi:hypothetical protein
MFVSHHEFLYGLKPGEVRQETVSIKSNEDFPTLGQGLGAE